MSTTESDATLQQKSHRRYGGFCLEPSVGDSLHGQTPSVVGCELFMTPCSNTLRARASADTSRLDLIIIECDDCPSPLRNTT